MNQRAQELRPSLSVSASGPRSSHTPIGAWVEGALTSGAGIGAICRPLTDWPSTEARLLRSSGLRPCALGAVLREE